MPEVTITSVEKISDTLARIVAELSQDIDQGFVSFQKNRNDTWTNMVTDNGEKDFALAPKKTVIVGETYTLDNSIGMYDNNKQLIAKLDPETGKITIQPEYQKTVSLAVATQNNHPVVQVVRGNTVLFVVNFEPLELVNITVPASAYKVSVIDNADF
ncbi:hypothetical protein J5893_03540 [bacterium]|nr:hypothetical protein [bacterium]